VAGGGARGTRRGAVPPGPRGGRRAASRRSGGCATWSHAPRERLYLSWARARYRYGRLEMAEPSRFLEAVPHA
jgi:superfamily I DNA/RNA helicase